MAEQQQSIEVTARQKADMAVALQDYIRRLNNDFTRRHLGAGYDAYVARFSELLGVVQASCVNHLDRAVREVLDGDPLCQSCCDDWVREEAIALASAQAAK